MGSMDKPPTASQREKKMQKGQLDYLFRRELDLCIYTVCVCVPNLALQVRSEKRLEAEQKRRAKFKTEVYSTVYTCSRIQYARFYGRV